MPVPEALDTWERLRRQFAAQLRVEEPGKEWLQRFRDLARQFRELGSRNTDLALYLAIHATGHEVAAYSSHHAMACALVGELAARWLGWTEEELESLVHAALSMNLSMTALQDQLAEQPGALSEGQRQTVAGHAAASATMLSAAGVEDLLWLQVVREHHVAGDPDTLESGPPGRRLAELLRRIDIYTAKLSRRGHRTAASPALAARDACLGPAGHPDSIGATLLRVLGLYPPGTWVALANGEVGIVTARGPKAHTPAVAAVLRPDGGLLLQPLRRDTALRSFAVVRGVNPRDVRVRLYHQKVLGC